MGDTFEKLSGAEREKIVRQELLQEFLTTEALLKYGIVILGHEEKGTAPKSMIGLYPTMSQLGLRYYIDIISRMNLSRDEETNLIASVLACRVPENSPVPHVDDRGLSIRYSQKHRDRLLPVAALVATGPKENPAITMIGAMGFSPDTVLGKVTQGCELKLQSILQQKVHCLHQSMSATFSSHSNMNVRVTVNGKRVM